MSVATRIARLLGGAAFIVRVVVGPAFAAVGVQGCERGFLAQRSGIEARVIDGVAGRARVLEQAEAVGRGAVRGDVLLQGGQLEVLVGGMTRGANRGGILGVRQGATVHDWESLLPRLVIEGHAAEIAMARVQLRRVGDRPAVTMEGEVVWKRSKIRVRRWLRIADVGSAVRITTVVTVPREERLRLAVVERVTWGGGGVTVPMHLSLSRGVPVTAEWVGRTLGRDAAVLGAMAGPVDIEAEPLDHGEVGSLRHTDVRLPTRAQAGGEWRSDAILSLSSDGAAEAVRRFGWARRAPFTEATVTLPSPAPGARVRVAMAESLVPVITGYPDGEHRVLLPLPPQALGATLVVVALAGERVATKPVPLPGPPYPSLQLSLPTQSTLSVRASAQAHGGRLPVRIRVKAYPGTPAPNLGPDWLASGAIDTVIAASGHSDVQLPAGRYRVLVTHGPEWSVFDRDVQLDVGGSTLLDAKLERVMDRGDWIACDFHVHAMPSPDSNVSLIDRVASLVVEGIDFAVPTDHNHVTDYTEAVQAQPLRGLTTVPGIEVTTHEPSYGHFNAFPFPLMPEAAWNGAALVERLAPSALFEALHGLDPDLVVQVNHPRHPGGIGYFELTGFDAKTGRGDEFYSDDYDALEIWNGFELAEPDRVEALFSEWLLMLARGRRVVATAGSDSHTIRTETAGYPRTYVRLPVGGAARGRDVVSALKQGRAFMTNGPLLHVRIGNAETGDDAVLGAAGGRIEATVQSPQWMPLSSIRVYLGGTLLQRAALRPLPDRRSAGLSYRYRHAVTLPAGTTGPLVITVAGDAPVDPLIVRWNMRPLAISNPIWLRSAPSAPQSNAVPVGDALR